VLTSDVRPSRNWHSASPDQAAGALPWTMVLPVRTRRATATQSLELAIRQRLGQLAPEALAPIAAALLAWWPLRPKRARGLEVVLVQANGSREKVVLHPPLVRIGRDASCHLQLPASTVSREHCEIRVEEDRLWIVDLESTSGTWVNGYRLEALEQRPLLPGDQIDIHPFRLVIGRMDVESAEPSVRLEPIRPLALEGDPFQQLGTPDSLWVAARSGGFATWFRLPTTWVAHSYRALGYQAPQAPEDQPHNPVDRAITAFLLGRAAQTLGESLGRTVEITAPLAAEQARRVAGAGAVAGRWEGAELGLDLSGLTHQVVAVWQPGALGRLDVAREASQGWPADLHFDVAVEAGLAVLSYRDLPRLEPGDIVLPDEWWPARPASGGEAVAGAVRLRLQGWTREARLAAGASGGPAGLSIESAWSIAPKGAVMGSSGPRTMLGDANAPAMVVPDELETLLVFELERINVPLRELVSWQPGATILLERSADDPIRIVLEQAGGPRVLGTGRVVVVDGKLGVQIESWHLEARPREGAP
jgi:flagellar motor switch/type III secretory pathway protein FliN